jgi:hypothetical protein
VLDHFGWFSFEHVVTGLRNDVYMERIDPESASKKQYHEIPEA